MRRCSRRHTSMWASSSSKSPPAAAAAASGGAREAVSCTLWTFGSSVDQIQRPQIGLAIPMAVLAAPQTYSASMIASVSNVATKQGRLFARWQQTASAGGMGAAFNIGSNGSASQRQGKALWKEQVSMLTSERLWYYHLNPRVSDGESYLSYLDLESNSDVSFTSNDKDCTTFQIDIARPVAYKVVLRATSRADAVSWVHAIGNRARNSLSLGNSTATSSGAAPHGITDNEVFDRFEQSISMREAESSTRDMEALCHNGSSLQGLLSNSYLRAHFCRFAESLKADTDVKFWAVTEDYFLSHPHSPAPPVSDPGYDNQALTAVYLKRYQAAEVDSEFVVCWAKGIADCFLAARPENGVVTAACKLCGGDVEVARMAAEVLRVISEAEKAAAAASNASSLLPFDLFALLQSRVLKFLQDGVYSKFTTHSQYNELLQNSLHSSRRLDRGLNVLSSIVRSNKRIPDVIRITGGASSGGKDRRSSALSMSIFKSSKASFAAAQPRNKTSTAMSRLQNSSIASAASSKVSAHPSVGSAKGGAAMMGGSGAGNEEVNNAVFAAALPSIVSGDYTVMWRRGGLCSSLMDSSGVAKIPWLPVEWWQRHSALSSAEGRERSTQVHLWMRQVLNKDYATRGFREAEALARRRAGFRPLLDNSSLQSFPQPLNPVSNLGDMGLVVLAGVVYAQHMLTQAQPTTSSFFTSFTSMMKRTAADEINYYTAAIAMQAAEELGGIAAATHTPSSSSSTAVFLRENPGASDADILASTQEVLRQFAILCESPCGGEGRLYLLNPSSHCSSAVVSMRLVTGVRHSESALGVIELYDRTGLAWKLSPEGLGDRDSQLSSQRWLECLGLYCSGACTQIAYQGALYKRGVLNPGFQRRWFVLLSNRKLLYFREEHEKSKEHHAGSKKGCIDFNDESVLLTSMDVPWTDDSVREMADLAKTGLLKEEWRKFSLRVRGRTFHFEAETARDAACWVGVLFESLQHARRAATGTQMLVRRGEAEETGLAFIDDANDIIL